MTRTDRIKMVEHVMRGLVTQFELTPAEVMTGVHNASVHGTIYEGGVNFGKDEEHLHTFFKGMETAIKAANKMEK